jgi:hypothetical protein
MKSLPCIVQGGPGAFLRLYTFLSQIFHYRNTALEKLAIFYRCLLSVKRQCELLVLACTAYYQPRPVSEADQRLMRRIDELHLKHPYYGARGRWIDNVFIERLWRTVKYEEVYLHAYRDGREARRRLSAYFEFYSTRRLHQALDYRTPDEVYFEARAAGGTPAVDSRSGRPMQTGLGRRTEVVLS